MKNTNNIMKTQEQINIENELARNAKIAIERKISQAIRDKAIAKAQANIKKRNNI